MGSLESPNLAANNKGLKTVPPSTSNQNNILVVKQQKSSPKFGKRGLVDVLVGGTKVSLNIPPNKGETSAPTKKRRRKNPKNQSPTPVGEPLAGVATKVQEEHFTAAITTLQVLGRPIRTLVDTGAASSIISRAWVQFLKMEEQIQAGDKRFVDARGKRIPVHGKVTLPVEFGSRTFHWTFWVADVLIAPIILGINILKDGKVDVRKGIVTIHGEKQPISITTQEGAFVAVVANHNASLVAGSTQWIEGRVIYNNIYQRPTRREVIITGLQQPKLAVASMLTKTQVEQRPSGMHEIVALNILNASPRRQEVRRGTVLAVVENIACISSITYWDDEQDECYNAILSTTIESSAGTEVALPKKSFGS
jgi:hypothetical protein